MLIASGDLFAAIKFRITNSPCPDDEFPSRLRYPRRSSRRCLRCNEDSRFRAFRDEKSYRIREFARKRSAELLRDERAAIRISIAVRFIRHALYKGRDLSQGSHRIPQTIVDRDLINSRLLDCSSIAAAAASPTPQDERTIRARERSTRREKMTR
jgi:hypothetical protein